MATGIGMIAIWWFPALLIVSVRSGGWKACGRFVAGFFALEIMIHGGGLLLGGDTYVDGVFRFHGLKAPANPGYQNFGLNPFMALLSLPENLEVLFTSTGFKKVMYYHGVEVGLLVAVALPWLCLTWLKQRRRTKETAVTNRGVELWLLAFAAGLAFMASIREQYDFYWVVFLPVVAALLALAARSLIHHFAQQKPGKWAGVVLTALLLAAALPLSGCLAIRAADTAKDATVFTTKTAVKGTVGAGKLATRPFRERDDDLSLRGQKCRACGSIQFPAQRVCESCFSRDEFESGAPLCLHADAIRLRHPKDDRWIRFEASRPPWASQLLR